MSDIIKMTKVCNKCKKASTLSCSRCEDSYCSVLCQQVDWQRHRYLCFPMPPLISNDSYIMDEMKDNIRELCKLNKDVCLSEHQEAVKNDISQCNVTSELPVNSQKRDKINIIKPVAQFEAVDPVSEATMFFDNETNATVNPIDPPIAITTVKPAALEPRVAIPAVNIKPPLEVSQTVTHKVIIESPAAITQAAFIDPPVSVPQLETRAVITVQPASLPQAVTPAMVEKPPASVPQAVTPAMVENPPASVPEAAIRELPVNVDPARTPQLVYSPIATAKSPVHVDLSASEQPMEKSLGSASQSDLSNSRTSNRFFQRDISYHKWPERKHIKVRLLCQIQMKNFTIVEDNPLYDQHCNKIIEDIANYIKMTDETSYTPLTDELVLAKFEGDFYRAVVLGCDIETETYSVLYLDYGNLKEVEVVDMIKFPEFLLDAEVFPLLCHVKNYPEKMSTKTEEILLTGKITIDEFQLVAVGRCIVHFFGI